MKKGDLLSGFNLFVTAHPWWILLSIIIAVSAMAGGIANLGFKNDYRVYLVRKIHSYKHLKIYRAPIINLIQ